MNPKAWSLNPCARGRHIETRFQNKLVESANRTSARSSVSSSSRRSNRKVDFSSVTIREYPRILGDNPSCSCGAPVTFDWHYYPQQEYRTLDEYERDFPHRRHRHQMKLPSCLRHQILLHECGYTLRALAKVVKETQTVRDQRSATARKKRWMCKAEERAEDVGRKIKRALKKRSSMSSRAKNTYCHNGEKCAWYISTACRDQ